MTGQGQGKGPGLTSELSALQQAWRGRASFTLFDSHFGQGSRFEAVLQAWRTDPQRPQRLLVVSAALEALPASWPPPTPNLHLLDFEAGQVRLLLLQGTAQPWRKLRQVQADMLWLDGRQMQHIQVCARLAAPGAQVWLVHASDAQREALRVAGFVAETAERARYAPRHRMAAVPVPVHATVPTTVPTTVPKYASVQSSADQHVIVIGAGIAGACTAAALARQGRACTVLDAAQQPASGASGNAAAVFHGTVHGADGTHARFTRACALHAQRVYAALLARGVPGAVSGLLRAGDVAASGNAARASSPAWAQAWTAQDLQVRSSGVRAESAWFFPGGGWVDAGATVHALLATSGVQFQGGVAASSLRRQGALWQVLAADGSLLCSAPTVVVACAGSHPSAVAHSNALLASAAALPWPATRARGQVTLLEHTGSDLPWPVTGGGYAVSLAPGRVLCGATTADGDDTVDIRASDHAYNLHRLHSLTGITPREGVAQSGKVGWRERAPDRLPVLGAAVCSAAVSRAASTLPQIRQLPRVAGLYMLGALSGRGFTWGPLAGEVLASLICNTPVPLEGDLLDAVDPGRFWLRQAWRSAGSSLGTGSQPK